MTPRYEHSIPITTFHRIPEDQILSLIPEGTTFIRSDHFYHIQFEFDSDREQLVLWEKNNPGTPDESFKAIGDLMDQLPSQ